MFVFEFRGSNWSKILSTAISSIRTQLNLHGVIFQVLYRDFISVPIGHVGVFLLPPLRKLQTDLPAVPTVTSVQVHTICP